MGSKQKLKYVYPCILLIWIFSNFGCIEKKGNSHKLNTKINILATTGMLQDALLNIAKSRARVDVLMKPGVDPHLFKPTLTDVKKLTSADAIFYNGLHLEGKMSDIIRKAARLKPVIAASDGVEHIRLRRTAQFAGSYDPHIWFDVQIWSQAVAHISRALQQLDTANAAYYHANTIAYLKELRALDSLVHAEMAQIPIQQRVLITAHDAFGYFGDAYHVQVKGLLGMSTVSDFGLKDVTGLVDFIVKNKIKAVFVESSVPKRSIEAVIAGARGKGHTVRIGGTLYSDAMGASGTPEGTYIGMVKANVYTIAKGLK